MRWLNWFRKCSLSENSLNECWLAKVNPHNFSLPDNFDPCGFPPAVFSHPCLFVKIKHFKVSNVEFDMHKIEYRSMEAKSHHKKFLPMQISHNRNAEYISRIREHSVASRFNRYCKSAYFRSRKVCFPKRPYHLQIIFP